MKRLGRKRPGIRNRYIASIALIAIIGVSTGCSRKLLSVFFDVSVPVTSVEAQAVAVVPTTAPPVMWAMEDTLRPPIEKTFEPDSVIAMMPRDHAGNIDWMQAMRDGTIKPRTSIPGESMLRPETIFGFDFVFKNAAPIFDANFPHSAHTAWLDCAQCHPRIFKYRDTKVSMGEIAQGRYCGECHGKVAFPVTTACERCHETFPQAANRAQPALIGDIRMKRANRPAEAPVSETATVEAPANADPLTDAFPEATFPHWVHRIHFKCKVCHMEIFEPKQGANEILMSQISAGEKCGRCHNGNVAFDTGFTNCSRCHLPTMPAQSAAK